MYYAESDILSIVIGVLTLLAGVYSSYAGSKKKKKTSAGSSGVQQEDGTEEIYDFLDRPSQSSENETATAEIDESPLMHSPELQESFDGGQMVGLSEMPRLSAEDEGLPSTGIPESATATEKDKTHEKGSSLKERLKSSPEDIVLFSELMKPKYKEY